MSTDRSRFSGTASIFNRINQLFFVIKFWGTIALLVSLIVFGWRSYSTFKMEGVGAFFARATVYEFSVKAGQPLPWLVADIYRSAVVLQAPQYLNFYRQIQKAIKIASYQSACAGGLVLILGVWLGRREAQIQTEDRHRRGSLLATPKKLNLAMCNSEGKGQIQIGGITIPKPVETRGIISVGMLGVGKTQLQNRIMDVIVDRQERGIIFSAKGDDYITTHWRDGDSIFCPADARTVGWSLMSDVSDIGDFDVIAESLVDDTAEKTKFWSGGAKMIISGLLKFCYLTGRKNNRQICEIFALDPTGMRDCLRNTPSAEQAAGLLDEPMSPPSVSFHITVCLYARPLQLLKHIEGDFSVSGWVKEGKGRIYLPATPKLHRQLGVLYSVFFDLAIVHHLSLPNSRERRIWYGLDELSALGKIPGLSQLANVGRSKGAAIFAGTQAYPQLDLLYGHDQRRALLNGFATRAIFRNEDERTLEELSKTLGRHDVERNKENFSNSFNINRDGVTKMTETSDEALVKPDEIKNLEALHFYVHSSGYPAAKTRIKFREWPELIPAHIPHPKLSLSALSAEYSGRHNKSCDLDNYSPELQSEQTEPDTQTFM